MYTFSYLLVCNEAEMNGPLEPELLLHLEFVDCLDVLDAHRFHVLGAPSIYVPVGLLHSRERVMFPVL